MPAPKGLRTARRVLRTGRIFSPGVKVGYSLAVSAARSDGTQRRRSQVVKAEVCKTSTHRFDSGRRLQPPQGSRVRPGKKYMHSYCAHIKLF